VTGILVALAVGFLLGMLVMVLLVSGRQEEELVDRVERREGRT
jgi:hypothetical protein